MINYATFGVIDKAASTRFFEAVLAPLGYHKFYDDAWAGFAIDGNPELPGTIWVGAPFNGEPAKPSNGMMVGLAAPSRAAVRSFHQAALANGGACEGPPSIREIYGPNVYMAYVRDPAGNKFSATCHKDSE